MSVACNNTHIRGRPLMTWGGGRRKSRKKSCGPSLGKKSFIRKGIPGKNIRFKKIINGCPLILRGIRLCEAVFEHQQDTYQFLTCKCFGGSLSSLSAEAYLVLLPM